MQRIETFLEEPEVPAWASSLKKQSSQDHAYKAGFENATFSFPSSPKSSTRREFILGPLDVEFPRGQLTLISGGTSSGKSALLASLLGGEAKIKILKMITSPDQLFLEMECRGGRVNLDKSNHQLAFCAQNPCKSRNAARIELPLSEFNCRVGACNNP